MKAENQRLTWRNLRDFAFQHSARVFDGWADDKIMAFLRWRARTGTLIVASEDCEVAGFVAWHRIPDDLDPRDAVQWTWQQPASAGCQVYISALVASCPAALQTLAEEFTRRVNWRDSKIYAHRRGRLVNVKNPDRYGTLQARHA